MNQRWTLHVENFARIKEADIEISPLMCFIGDNNSGKSYMMSLLWGIIANGYTFFYYLFKNYENMKTYKKCEKWLLDNIGRIAIINDEVEKMYVDLFNELLEMNKLKLLKRTFNNDIDIEKIEIRNFKRKEKLSVYFWDVLKNTSSNAIQDDGNLIMFEMSLDKNKWVTYHGFICWYLLMEDIAKLQESLTLKEIPIYFPASRTGFVLTYSNIASNAIQIIFSQDSPNNLNGNMTLPYINFLQNLITLKEPKELKFTIKESLLKFIKNNLIKGEVNIKEDGRIIRYKPVDIEKELPMSLTSSVVTEIAPLLLMLTTHDDCPLFIIEEPEAHLHPELQKKIAQLIILLTHSGTNVWITTHSDTILQHFNNMIKLNNRSEQERNELLEQFNYTKDDLLSPEEINLYQFTREDTHTTIKSLESGKYGFVVPSFNKAIDELMQEIFAFQEDD